MVTAQAQGAVVTAQAQGAMVTAQAQGAMVTAQAQGAMVTAQAQGYEIRTQNKEKEMDHSTETGGSHDRICLPLTSTCTRNAKYKPTL
jgi:hypothetical protein